MKKEDYKDQGLRQALQRRNEAAERMTLPEDFTDRLMRRLEPTPNPSPREGRTKTLRWMATAACLLIIIGVGMALLPKEEPAKTQQIVVKKTEKPLPQPLPREGSSESLPYGEKFGGESHGENPKKTVAKAKAVSQRPTQTTATHNTPTAVATTDSLDYYIDKIERELAQVDESLYIERMNKVIRADERLQRMVNSYILHTLDKEGRPQTAANMYNEKSEQDEE
jgi:cell division septal protein FtsQ